MEEQKSKLRRGIDMFAGDPDKLETFVEVYILNLIEDITLAMYKLCGVKEAKDLAFKRANDKDLGITSNPLDK